jgi:acyl transferase domain-containing protein
MDNSKPFDILQIIYPLPGATPTNDINQTKYTQPVLFSFEYSMARMLMSWDIKPAIVTGHSVGEYVAACVAEVFSLEDAIKLILARARYF